MSYAKRTAVSVPRSRIEIEALLQKYKASRIGVITEVGRATVAFTIGNWSVRFKLPLPTGAEANGWRDRNGWSFSEAQKQKRIEQESRERWRALLLTIKAKLVSVESNVETFEEAFMAHLVMSGGATAGESFLPELREQAKQLPSGLKS